MNTNRQNINRNHNAVRLALPAIGLMSLLGLSVLGNGCNTVEGVGEDIKSASVNTKTAIDDATGSKSTTQDKGAVEGQGANQAAKK